MSPDSKDTWGNESVNLTCWISLAMTHWGMGTHVGNSHAIFWNLEFFSIKRVFITRIQLNGQQIIHKTQGQRIKCKGYSGDLWE